MNTKCPFSSIQSAGVCECELADEVVRRGGSEYDCTQPEPHQKCTQLADFFIEIGLPALGYEDDLTLTPKSVYDKAWIGGLQGLNEHLNHLAPETYTKNLWGLISELATEPKTLPSNLLTEKMQAYKPSRRKGRRK